jgi:multidrug efflux system membrane fusion protein
LNLLLRSSEVVMAFRNWIASAAVFLVIIVAVVVWIGSGMLAREPEPPPAAAEERPRTVVAASWSEARPVERFLTLFGEVEANQVVQVRARTEGQVEELHASLGDAVEPQDELAQLALDDRPAQRAQAEARLANAEREFQAAEQLLERGTGTVAQRDAARAELEAARSDLAAVERDIANTTIRAPVEGIVNDFLADVGDYVSVGGEVVEIVDNDPLRVVVQVPQHAVEQVSRGDEARVRIVGGRVAEGIIRFIAPAADAATRTFRVEIVVANPDRALPSGISAEVVLPTETVSAHRISPALVGLDDQGRIGVYTVDEDDIVGFHMVEAVRTEADGIWVAGLPERARIVTIRPGFVRDGQEVEVRETPAEYDAVVGALRE